jgi:Xaa-Pro aminopeptidase
MSKREHNDLYDRPDAIEADIEELTDDLRALEDEQERRNFEELLDARDAAHNAWLEKLD